MQVNPNLVEASDIASSVSPTPPPTSTPSPPPTPTPTPIPTPTPGAARSAGCGTTPKITGNAKNQVIHAAGLDRNYQIIVPSAYNSAEAIPLLFGFHYVNGTSATVEGENVQSYGEKAIYIFPQGLKLGSYFGWTESCGGNDMALVSALIDYVEANYCINTDRLYAYGMSWGGDMSNAVGCCLGSKFRAVAPMSGGEIGSGTKACTTPTPAFMIQYGGKDQSYSQNSFLNVINSYRTLQACGSSTVSVDANCVSYTGCKKEVRSCFFPNLDHNLAPDFAQRLWSFFSQQK